MMTRHQFNPPAAADRRRGMTLLELIVSITILTAVSTLVATLWGQMQSWTDDNGKAHEAVRLQRTIEFMKRQWSDRRSFVELENEDAAGVYVNSERLEFVTASPALFPQWPLVRAVYYIEGRSDSAASSTDKPRRLRLMYEEERLSSMGSDDKPIQRSRDERRIKQIALLENCADLHWSRFDTAAAARIESGRAGSDSISPWRDIAPNEHGRTGTNVKKSEDNERLLAVRLEGVYENEEFEWPFIVEALR